MISWTAYALLDIGCDYDKLDVIILVRNDYAIRLGFQNNLAQNL